MNTIVETLHHYISCSMFSPSNKVKPVTHHSITCQLHPIKRRNLTKTTNRIQFFNKQNKPNQIASQPFSIPVQRMRLPSLQNQKDTSNTPTPTHPHLIGHFLVDSRPEFTVRPQGIPLNSRFFPSPYYTSKELNCLCCCCCTDCS